MAPIDAKIDLANPRHLAAARGLAAAVRDLDKRGVAGAEVKLHLPQAGGGRDVVVVGDPRALAARAETAFAEQIARALNKLAGGEPPEEHGVSAWRTATRAALSTGTRAVTIIKPPLVQAGRAVAARTPDVVKRRGAQAGAAVMWGLNEGLSLLGQVVRGTERGRRLMQRISNSHLVAERAYVEVRETNGLHYVYAPWVVDPIATLANESFAFRLNMTSSTIGFVPFTAPAIQALAAGWLYAWGWTYSTSPEGEASKNMAIEAAIQTLATVVPGPGWVTLPAALVAGGADSAEISEGIERGDPFVTFSWSRTGRP
ncbi:MAG: hypothetical protein ACAI38_13320 [Myxococcota bacterium]